ncbi:hypothetical protein SRHO_G00226000 [Serrasalmus rhombeus]
MSSSGRSSCSGWLQCVQARLRLGCGLDRLRWTALPAERPVSVCREKEEEEEVGAFLSFIFPSFPGILASAYAGEAGPSYEVFGRESILKIAS